jgi:1-phosphofructokinase
LDATVLKAVEHGVERPVNRTSRDRANVCVFAPALFVTVTIEAGNVDGADEVHFHPGGQGFWIARMLRHLGERPVLCGLVGGESGDVLRSLIPRWGVDFSPVTIDGVSPAYVHDRRSGERLEVATTSLPTPNRHELDDLYGRVLERAIGAGLLVIAGRSPGHDLDVDIFRRLGSDLATAGVEIVADLHGDELDALLEGGPVSILKVSADDLAEDGLLSDSSEPAVLAAIGELRRRGAAAVVVSRADDPALAVAEAGALRASSPRLLAVDHRGAGDSMTAGLAAGLHRGLSPVETLRLGCAAGAANVTRHGLGSATDTLVDRLLERVDVEEIELGAEAGQGHGGGLTHYN